MDVVAGDDTEAERDGPVAGTAAAAAAVCSYDSDMPEISIQEIEAPPRRRPYVY